MNNENPIEIRLRPTHANDFLLNLYSDAWGEEILCFASEPEVYDEFERVAKRIPPSRTVARMKQIALQLVQTMQVDRGPLASSAHAAFTRLFPKGFRVDC